jgi:hypothetical protein
MQVNSAQDYLTQVKRQILAKAPALALALSPQNRRSNDTYTAQLANRASRYEKVPYPQTLSLAPGSVPGFAYVTPGLRPTVSLCCVAAAVAAPFVDVWAGKLAVVTTLSAVFNTPWGVAGLSNGNVVVTDTGNSTIRLITPTAVVTTLAGSTSGTADGTGAAAQFSTPVGVAELPNGNIVVSETGSHRIRLVTPGGVVTTLAGSTAGFLDGTGTGAQFNNPYAVAVLPNGNIVVADASNHRIRLITMPGGVVTTLAGSGGTGSTDATGTSASFNLPAGVAVLPNGDVIVADNNNHRIRRITVPGGVVTTLAGSSSGFSDNPIGTSAQFSNPYGVTVLPNGNIVVADLSNTRIRLITMPSGAVTTLAGNGSFALLNGVGTATSFNQPHSVGVLPNGSIVVGDRYNNAVRLITPT